MTHVFGEHGKMVPVTVLQAGPCTVLDVRTAEKNTYSAIQLAFEDRKESKVKKPVLGQFKKSKVSPKNRIREIRLDEAELKNYEIGQTLSVDIFKAGDFIDVTGTSKGRGFTGVIKRHNMSGFPASHGTHEAKRHAGSIGSAYPQHVRKGVRMAGQHGNARSTVQNLEIFDIDTEQNLILVKGAVPGANTGYLLIKKAIKK